MMASGKLPLPALLFLLFHLPNMYRLINAGILAPKDPKHRYKYQLLDPAERPYATIKFYYRSTEYLTTNGIIPPPSNHSRQTSTASDSSGASSQSSKSGSCITNNARSSRSPTPSAGTARVGSSRSGSPPTDSVAAWLRHHRLQKYSAILAHLSFEALVTLSDNDLIGLGVHATGARGKLLSELASYKQHHIDHIGVADYENPKETETKSGGAMSEAAIRSPSTSTTSSKASKTQYLGYCLGNPETNRSLHIVTKDCVESPTLPTPPGITLSAPPKQTIFTIENSPLSPPSESRSSAPAHKTNFSTEEIKPVSPAPPISTIKSHKKPRKSLKVEIHGTEFELEKEASRPMSPFTSGGMLRRILGPPPPSAPARITEFGPTVNDEIGGMLAEMEAGVKSKPALARTTRAERGGGMLKRILGKRIGRG